MSRETAKGKLDRIVLANCLSTSGRWQLLLCEHIVGGKFCYDVVAFNNEGGFTLSRHYNSSTTGQFNDEVNKAEALKVYDTYREGLTSPAGPEEGNDEEPLIYISPGEA